MTERKQTPDVLGELFGATPKPTTTPDPPQTAPAPPPSKPRQSARKKQSGVESQLNLLKPKPVQWEYLQVTFYEYDGWRARYVNHIELDGWKEGPSMVSYLNALGNMGWEMSGLVDGGRHTLLGYFKRQKR
ncbi:MAG: hypothetical protein J5I90_21505 [Caldilineales bacterium]|nr:hypothetical protein [Caldilineales bacterium]